MQERLLSRSWYVPSPRIVIVSWAENPRGERRRRRERERRERERERERMNKTNK